jgi:hypothetical protein
MPLVRRAVLGKRLEDRVAGVGVQRLALPGRLEQPPLVRLAVDRDQVRGHVTQHRHRYRRTAQKRP